MGFLHKMLRIVGRVEHDRGGDADDGERVEPGVEHLGKREHGDLKSRMVRADYAPSTSPGTRKAMVATVRQGSPASAAGIESGCVIVRAGGMRLRDIIDWFWVSDGFDVDVEFIDLDGRLRSATLFRKPMQDWGFKFCDNIFDDVITCRNACTFCFMAMLPRGMRSGMYLRDDDYRLSFLQGNFVTLTNMSDADIDRVVEMGLSPLHMSVHALDPHARLALMGKNHQRGLDVMQRLLDAGIDLHMQVVLVPGVNDGDVLRELASWAVEQEHVLSLGVVPLGYTRYQDRFERSFDDPRDALEVIELAKPIQEASRRMCGATKLHLADEFYANAYGDDVAHNLPPASHYDGYPQFHDGIGMLRSLVDDWESQVARCSRTDEPECSVGAAGSHFAIVCGRALAPLMGELASRLPQDVAKRVDVLAVPNAFFGGNVDVSGLLTASDVIEALGEGLPEESTVLLPDAMFNSEGLTLDNRSAADISQAILRPVRVICYCAEDIFNALQLPWRA